MLFRLSSCFMPCKAWSPNLRAVTSDLVAFEATENVIDNTSGGQYASGED